MPPSNQAGGLFHRKSAVSRPASTNLKAARKLQPVDTESDSSDTRIATTSSSHIDDSDSDNHRSRSDHDIVPPLPQRRQVAKPRKRVTFNVQDNASDSDDTAVHVQPSKNRVQHDIPILPEVSGVPRIGSQIKPSGTRKAPKSRGSPLDQSDIVDRRRSTPSFRVVKARRWRDRKEKRPARMSRMSIGSANKRELSQADAPQPDRRRRWFVRRGRIGTRAGRHTHYDDSESKSESHESDEDLPQVLTEKAPKAARKSISQSAMKRTRAVPVFQVESDNEAQPDTHDPPQDSDVILDEPANEYFTDQSEREEEEIFIPAEPSQVLLQRLEWLSLGVVRLHKMRRLPFLRRNLRAGFQLRCRMVGVDTKPHLLPRASVSVVYSCPIADEAATRSDGSHIDTTKSSMKDWLCPLCDLHYKFDNQTMLDKHLAWDHPNVQVQWDRDHTTLSLTIPDSQQEHNLVMTRTRQSPARELSSTSELSSDSKRVDKGKDVDCDKQPHSRIPSTPSSAVRESSSTSTSAIRSSVEEDLKLKSDVGTGDLTRDSYIPSRSASQALSGADAREGIGPSLSFPYLPESVDDKSEVYYSCRPGGPRLFDFLNTLPMKPYGVLKWVIIDREEELFELDDVLDEDKVMQALWFRWIFLNRNRFVANYFDGTKTFIRENWEPIKQGAGLLALRTWLLVLLVNNFLLPTEVATLMRYYQELAGIQLP